MTKAAVRTFMGQIFAVTRFARVVGDLPALCEFLIALRDHAAAFAVIGDDATAPGDDTIMLEDTGKPDRNNIARTKIIFTYHR